MPIRSDVDLGEYKARIAQRISDFRLSKGQGALGELTIKRALGAARTYKHHWTGYRILYPNPTLLLRADLKDGTFWTEGYISSTQASWVLSFRKDPPKTRGTGGPRPDDKFANPQAVEASYAYKQSMKDAGVVHQEELIRAEDFDDPREAIDQFFNYTSLYVLKAIDGDWSGFSYSVDASVEWDDFAEAVASLPIDAAIDEGLKRSDIIWVTLDSDPDSRPVPCWFLYTKDKRLFVLSGEREQTLVGANRASSAHVVTRWKGRDARMAEFDAAVRAITGAEGEEFREVAGLLVAKRQSVRGTTDENIKDWMLNGVILELTPRS